MTNKMTKKDMFTAIKANLTDAEQIAFIDHEIELLDNLSDVPTTIAELMKREGLVVNRTVVKRVVYF